MSDPERHSPRRYVVDVSGQRVLVGLTLEETSEFEGLDTSLSLQPGRDQPHLTGSVVTGRWLELYDKHDKAWVKWMAELKARRNSGSLFFN